MINADWSGAEATLGYIDGVASELMNRQYLAAAMDYTTAVLGGMFESQMDKMAYMKPDSYHHVYEWGESYGSRETVGLPQFRLWKLVETGSGAQREVSFAFLPSHRPTPIEEELLVPGKKGRTVNTDVHIFTWKAMVMELGLPVTIYPKLAKKLVYVDDKTGKLVFTTKTIRTTPGFGSNGKPDLAGNFTAFYTAWWTDTAPQIFERDIKPKLEFDVVHPRGAGGRFIKRSERPPAPPEQAVKIGLQSFQAGRAEAIAYLNKNKQDYKGRAARRRMEKYGY